MKDTFEKQLFDHPEGFAAVYTDDTVEKLNKRRPGRPSLRFNIIQKGEQEGKIVVENITASELRSYQKKAERFGNPIDVYYYQPDANDVQPSGEVTIQSLRMQSGLSQKEFGDFLYGIPSRSIQNWEGGQKSCPDYLVKLIEYKLKKENVIQDDSLAGRDEPSIT